VSFPHKNIYQEQFADFDLEKKENNNFLRANNDKIKINTSVANFCSQKFQYKFHQKGSMSQCATFALSSSKEHHSPPNFHFFTNFVTFLMIFLKNVLYIDV
jgi:hypothetical protein